jgi:hypothetical protein
MKITAHNANDYKRRVAAKGAAGGGMSVTPPRANSKRGSSGGRWPAASERGSFGGHERCVV